MRLTAEMLREISRTVTEPEAMQSDAGLRCARRIALEGRTETFPLIGEQVGRATRVTLLNISAAGIAFNSDLPMGLETQFIISLPTQQARPLRFLATVRRCQKTHEGVAPYLVAGTFDQQLTASNRLAVEQKAEPQTA